MKKRKGVYNGSLEEVFEYAFLKKKDLLVKGTGLRFHSDELYYLNHYDEEYVEFKHKYILNNVENNTIYSCELIIRPKTNSLYIGKFRVNYENLINDEDLQKSFTEFTKQLKEIAINGKFNKLIIWDLRDIRILEYFIKENWIRNYRYTYIYEIKDEKEN